MWKAEETEVDNQPWEEQSIDEVYERAKNYVTVFIDGKEFTAMIDSAADVSAVSTTAASKMTKRLFIRRNVKVIGFGGQSQMNIVFTKFVKLGNQKFKARLHCNRTLETLGVDIILGVDFLSKNRFSIDIGNAFLTNPTVQVRMFPGQISVTQPVSTLIP